MDFAPLKNVTQVNIDALNAMKAQLDTIISQHQSTLTELEQAENAVPTVADVKALIAKLPG